MKVLVVGGGGREHALAWKLAQSSRVDEVLVAPGNAGTAREPGVRNVAVKATDIDGLLQLARDEVVDVTIIGPEAPLVAGIVDRFTEAGLRCFGPSAAAAQLEGSKAFAKAFLERHEIPTAACKVFTELQPARRYVHDHGAPIVIKADGLAAGKGVVVAQTVDEADAALVTMLGNETGGTTASSVVIEDFLAGEEASYIVISDGVTFVPMASSQDHKQRDEGGKGPNTGGMGAYSPAPIVTQAVEQRVIDTIVKPTLAGMAADGMPFAGFLYVGLMIDDRGMPSVVEFNVRFGDPETQPILMRLESDLLELVEHALDGTLEQAHVEWDRRPALGVVMASGGYPGAVRKGLPISGLDREPDVGTKVFHAGTAVDEDGNVVTSGGRVLCACALGEDLAAARERAYEVVSGIRFEDAYFRRDIGYLALNR